MEERKIVAPSIFANLRKNQLREYQENILEKREKLSRYNKREREKQNPDITWERGVPFFFSQTPRTNV